MLSGDLDPAAECFVENLDISTRIGYEEGVAYALEGCAGALGLAEQPELHALGARLLGGADHLRRQSGGPMPAGERYDVDRAEGRLRSAMGDAAFERQFSAGAATEARDLVDAVQSLVSAC